MLERLLTNFSKLDKDIGKKKYIFFFFNLFYNKAMYKE